MFSQKKKRSKNLTLYKYFNIEGDIETPNGKISRLDNLISILKDKKIYVPSLKELNDPFESYLMSQGELSGEYETYGVLSLTTSVSNNLMWSHYAISHKGISVAFSLDVAKAKKSGLKKVHYIRDISELHYFEEPLIVKSYEWAYENEYRYIFKQSKDKEFLDDLGLKIESVFIGSNVKSEHKKCLLDHIDCLDIKYSIASLGEDLNCNFSSLTTVGSTVRQRIFYEEIEPGPEEPNLTNQEYWESYIESSEQSQAMYDEWDKKIDNSESYKAYLSVKNELKGKLGYKK